MKFSVSETAYTRFFTIPLLAFLVLFVLIPVAGTLGTSFFQDISFLPKKFIFFDNYRYLFNDPHFLQALRFTLLFIITAVPLQILSGILCAVVLHQKMPFRGILRACILIPWVIPSAVSARTWELIFNYSYGIANFFLLRAGLIEAPVSWFGTAASSFLALVAADTWKTTPFTAIIILSGLQVIPASVYFQAQIDRANIFQRFFRITLPLIKPVILIALLFRTIDALRIFDLVYILTKGGPGGATTSLSMYSFKYFLSGDFGYGSAVTTVLFIISLILAVAYLRIGQFNKSVFT